MPAPNHAYSAPALEKGLDVLELLGRQAGNATLSAIAEALGLSRNHIFRVVRVLEARGYLLREGDGYSLSNRLFLLAARRRPFATLMDVAAPEMRALASAIGQSCHLTIPAGTRTVVIARVENPHAISIALPLGHNLPIHETASGRAILAMLPKEECERLIGRVEPRAERQLRTRLAQIRSRGYEISSGIRTLGVVDLSFPIFDAGSRPVGCLGVPLLRKRPADVALDRLITLARETAARITQGLAAPRIPLGRPVAVRPIRRRA